MDVGVKNSVNKKKKEAEKELLQLFDQYKNIVNDVKYVIDYDDIQHKLISEREHKLFLETYIQEQVRRVCYVLLNEGFVLQDIQENCPDPSYELTVLGKIASNIAEIHPLIFSKLLDITSYFKDFSVKQLIGLFSCFVDVKVLQDKKIHIPKSKDDELENIIKKMQNMYLHIENIEQESQIRTGIQYEDALSFDMIDDSMEWCDCSSEIECKSFIQNNIADKGISVGDFTKGMLKIATIAKEIGAICEEYNQIDLLYKLNQIDYMVLKYITTSQSLYV